MRLLDAPHAKLQREEAHRARPAEDGARFAVKLGERCPKWFEAKIR